ncbi:hypothetical protein [Deinococcus aestuarii]|uniref:hypothetical protein n=1 Tax=Deinococcus aestuarii TaxID=2774531 RepID=UPI001C0C7C46|nr:hypothetical protein [Deinococcus aestuarii]
MPGEHPATQKARLRTVLAVDRTLTTVQLERRGLLRAATWLGLPQVTLTCRTRTTQPHSDTDLSFVALDARWLSRPPRDLMHDAGLGEVRHRIEQKNAMPPRAVWQHVTLAGRQRAHLPDAEILNPHPRLRRDWSVEFDAGYAPTRVEQKLEAAAQAGYNVIIWATSVHTRTASVSKQAKKLHDWDRLPGVDGVVVVFVDFWSARDPYEDRPRCKKNMIKSTWFTKPAGAG